MFKVKSALFCFVLLLLLSGSDAAFAQAPQPAPAPTPSDLRGKVSETLIDSSIKDDPAVDKMLEAYDPKVRALNEVLGKLKGELRKGGVGAGSLGDFVTNALRAEAARKLGKPVAVAFTNAGGLRKSTITEGEVRMRDIFELLPFENSLVAFELSGKQLLAVLEVVIEERDAQSGARIKYKFDSDKRPEFEAAHLLINGTAKDIDPDAVYTVITSDYLMNVSGGDYSDLLKAARSIKPLHLTMRDAVTEFIRAETAAGREIHATFDGRYYFDKAESNTGGSSPR